MNPLLEFLPYEERMPSVRVSFIFRVVIQTPIYAPSPHLFIEKSLNDEYMESGEHQRKAVLTWVNCHVSCHGVFNMLRATTFTSQLVWSQNNFLAQLLQKWWLQCENTDRDEECQHSLCIMKPNASSPQSKATYIAGSHRGMMKWWGWWILYHHSASCCCHLAGVDAACAFNAM